MKTFKMFVPLSLVVITLLGNCSPKVSNERIDTLEGREAVLKTTSELNKLKLEIERDIVKQTKLIEDVEDINRKSSESARDAQRLSERVSRNPGDTGLAKRADRASREAASDAKRARKLNSQLDDINEEIRDLRKDIEKKEKQLSELKARVEFVPNN